MAIRRLFVANRGEIAVRIIRAAQSLGLETVQAYSEADRDMLAVRMADRAVCVGPAKAADSYLNISSIVAAAREAGADAVHPGYGFLSENAAFAHAVEEAGLIFVGPSPQVIERMGDKASAREAARAAGVPIVPGTGRIADAASAVEAAEAIGFPVMIKAAAGGGGRGIRVARDADELRRLAPQAQAEAQAAFGDGGLYLERAVERARHVEVQVLGDGRDAVHLWDESARCSAAGRRSGRRPAPVFPIKRASGSARARRAGAVVGYRGAGTLEYLFDEDSGEVFFIEMNTRIQVEHPVTELVTGLDLVALMIRVAGGEPLPVRQETCAPRATPSRSGSTRRTPAAISCPFRRVWEPAHPRGRPLRPFPLRGLRHPSFYDSLLGKLVVHAGTRDAAIDALGAALDGLEIGGVRTTVPLHQALCEDEDVRAGRVHTQWLVALGSRPGLERNAA
jgi:acetyl-CoA carboxylase biotin carboxylase subunit